MRPVRKYLLVTGTENSFQNFLCKTLQSWNINLNYYSVDGTADTGTPFVGGMFFPQAAGWYHICSFSRFKKGGNSNDVTVTVVSNEY